MLGVGDAIVHFSPPFVAVACTGYRCVGRCPVATTVGVGESLCYYTRRADCCSSIVVGGGGPEAKSNEN